MRRSAVALLAVGLSSALAAPTSRAVSDTTPLASSTIQLVKQRLAESGNDTWVAGTQTEALLELDYKPLSVFASSFYPVPSTPHPSEVDSIISAWAASRPSTTNQLALVQGGAAGDPASLGVGWIVASKTASDRRQADQYYAEVGEEVDYLLNDVPRTSDGAISHRPASEPVQLWSDFVCAQLVLFAPSFEERHMVPPFLAYHGVAASNATMIAEAYNQCRLYRKYLRTSSGAWQHIVLGDFQDTGLWSTGCVALRFFLTRGEMWKLTKIRAASFVTGNGWAAAGMARVLATIKHSDLSSAGSFASEVSDLTSWIVEILEAAFSYLQSDGLLPNYYDTSSFSEASGSALLASAAYRLAVLDPSRDYSSLLATAAKIRTAVNRGVSTSTGWVSPVVNPLDFSEQGSDSPESEAFVLLLQAAWQDWRAATGGA
ncbi:SPOSA6832_02447, partial [Sporobolomyces salmonicolor]